MTTYNTGNPLGSPAAKDLYDNAENFDHLSNDRENLTWDDRFGVGRKTWYGLESMVADAAGKYGFIVLTGKTFTTGATVNLNEILLDPSTNEYFQWTGEFPNGGKIIPPSSTPDSTGGQGPGKWLSVGDSGLRTWVNDNISINFNSVTTMIAGTAISGDTIPFIEGMVAVTFANQFNIKQESKWLLSATPDTTTYSVSLSNGGYANLICRADMNYAEFGFGGTDVQNVAAVDEGNRVARAQSVMRSLSFPAGTYNIGAFTLDVDRRGFTFDGGGWNLTYLISTSSGVSMQHVLIDPRNRARDREHYYQTVKGFTIDGNITGNAALAASRTVCSAHYAKIMYKSVGHRLSNFDLCGLVIDWCGHAQGRTNGSVITANCVRVRYNSIKLNGYIGGVASGVNTLIHGPVTTVASNVNVGDISLPVTSAVGYSVNDIIEITGSNLDAKTIVGISGNTLTLDSGLLYAHAATESVRVPVCGTLVSGTLEVGQVQIGNSSATELHGIYSEESRFYLFGYIDGLEIHGCLIAQATPSVTIDASIDRRSSIKIGNNSNEFTVAVNIQERGTSLVNENIDLYNWPEVDIQQNPHSVQGIYVNGRYIFKSIKTERFYDSSSTPNTITSFKFTGFPVTQSSPGSTEVLRFTQNSSLKGYDGHTFNITAAIRRANGLSGLLERKGQSSLIGATISDTPAASYKTLSNYFSPVTGLDLLVGSNTGRVGVVLRGEDSGGQSVKAIISGEVISII